MAPKAKQRYNLLHKPAHRALSAVHCRCMSPHANSPLFWDSPRPKAVQDGLSLGTARQKALQPEGIRVPFPEPFCTAQRQVTRIALTGAFPLLQAGERSHRPHRSAAKRSPAQHTLPRGGERETLPRGDPRSCWRSGHRYGAGEGDACD